MIIPIALLVSDIHLSSKPPIARSDEYDWYEAMSRPLQELNTLQDKYGIPIICAGDVFDKWNPPPELINFAIREMPEMWSIPGQHDLPYHGYSEIIRSGYWTLIESGVLKFLHPDKPNEITPDIVVHAFPWGFDLKPCTADDTDPSAIHIMVAHKYFWMRNYKYPGAPKESSLSSLRSILKTYDACHFGDNHQGFSTKLGNTHIINTGTFMRRRSDEAEYMPRVGLLHNDGSIKNHFLDTSKDILFKQEQTVTEEIEYGFDDFLDGLKELESDPLDYTGLIDERIHELSPNAQAIVRNIIEHARSE